MGATCSQFGAAGEGFVLQFAPPVQRDEIADERPNAATPEEIGQVVAHSIARVAMHAEDFVNESQISGKTLQGVDMEMMLDSLSLTMRETVLAGLSRVVASDSDEQDSRLLEEAYQNALGKRIEASKRIDQQPKTAVKIGIEDMTGN